MGGQLIICVLASYSEFESMRSSAAAVRVKNISNKICVVGKTYIKAERYFPVGKSHPLFCCSRDIIIFS